MTEPRRLIEDPSASDALREALEAGRELPDEAQLASLEARLGPLLGGGGGGGGAAPPASSGALLAKVSAGLLAAAAAAGVVYWAATDEPPRAPTPPPRVTREVVAEEPEPIPTGVDPPVELEPALPERAQPAEEPAPRRVRVPAPRPALETDPEAELALIRSAQDALRTSPRTALERTEEHRRRFGDGTLAQEREVVAIDALVREGRAAEARERADAFHRRWPRSAHGRRVDVLVAPR